MVCAARRARREPGRRTAQPGRCVPRGHRSGVTSMSIDFAPAPTAAPRTHMLAAQSALEFRLQLRNAEQVGLTLLIPLLLLFFFNLPLLYSLGVARRIEFVVPSIIA